MYDKDDSEVEPLDDKGLRQSLEFVVWNYGHSQSDKTTCPYCNDEAHEPGMCKRCNCGQSDVSHMTAPVDVSELDFTRDHYAETSHKLPVKNRGHRVKRKKTDN